MNIRARRWLLALSSSLLLCSGNSHAAYTGLTFFGDSFTDTGNLLSLTTAFQPPPFPAYPGAEGRFSNGPVWAETLAAGLGLPGASKNSNLIYNGTSVVPIGSLGGQNFAFGGARTGLGGAAGATTGLFGELIAWNGSSFAGSLTRAADPNALYVVLAGANDVRDFRSGNVAVSPLQAAVNVVNVIGLLAQAGAQHFLIGNLPDLGKTPEASALGLVSATTAATVAFNSALAANLGVLDAQFLAATGVDLDLVSLDLFGLSNAIYNDAISNGGAQFGITNVSSPCISPDASGVYFAPGSTGANCSVSAFSDPLHPSALTHRLIGDLALTTLSVSAVPEPSSFALVLAGLVVLVISRRRLS